MFKQSVSLAVIVACLVIAGVTGEGRGAELPPAEKEILISDEELVLNNGDTERALRSRLIWNWAAEYGAADEFSYDAFLQSLEAENKKREKIHAEGGPVYGPVQFTPLQYYRRLLGDCEQEIKKRLAQETEPSELAEYYAAHQEDYKAVDTVEAEYTIRQNGRVTYQGDVILDAGTIRGLSESDEELVHGLLRLEEGGEYVWTGRNGEEKRLLCIRREQGSCAPFEDVSGAVADQYADEMFEKELMIRTARYQMREQEETEEEMR